MSILLCLLFLTPAASGQPAQGLDPLTTDEIRAAKEILLRHPEIGASCLFAELTLQAPSKEQVLSGSTTHREARYVARYREDTFEGVIDLTADTIQSLNTVEGEHAFMLSYEWRITQVVVKNDSLWQQAMLRRGIRDFDEIICIPNTIGYFGNPDEEGRRLVRVTSYLKDGISNFWSRPVAGVTALLDLDKRQVLRVIDSGAVPLPDGRNLVDSIMTPAMPNSREVRMAPVSGVNFTIEGHWVEWYKWRFHLRLDPRTGLIISQVTFRDGDRRRQVMYSGSLSELFVPYMDPTEHWYSKTYLDAGEYGVGALAVPLIAGKHCPYSATLMDAVIADDWGTPFTAENVIAIFERYAGDPAWLHYEADDGSNHVRRNTELVVRFVAAVGNYDYIFDWVFKPDASIRVAVGASGIEQVKGISHAIAIPNGEALAYGHMVAPHTLAINHDHFFCYRLDLDVDGRNNSLQIDRLRTQDTDGSTPRKSIWTVIPHIARTEHESRMRINLEAPALWRIINPAVTNAVGYPVSYHLKPSGNAVSLLSKDEFPQIRAGFSDYHLWVTPYHAEEMYAAGKYPNQSTHGAGLPTWTSEDRAIENTDIVLWYNVGFHHVVRAEDWPVLPVSWHSFYLRPFDFFDQNPALHLQE